MALKVYLYDAAAKHVHDSTTHYKNTVPLSQEGLKHVDLVANPKDAEYFYGGQFSDGTPINKLNPYQFDYFKGNESRHIFDIEGDFLNKIVPSSFRGSILTINSALNQYKSQFKMFVRPTFSKLLVDIARNRHENFELPKNRSYGFLGLPDPNGIRYKVYKAFSASRLPGNYRFTEKFNAPSDLDSYEVKSYEEHMLSHCFALCPRGAGADSIRYFEACYYGRIPIIIGDNILPGELDGEDVSFAFRISQYTTEDLIQEILENIYEISDSELLERSKKARKYFEKVIRTYFKDPTLKFLTWLEKNR